jgi:hypothetical protein
MSPAVSIKDKSRNLATTGAWQRATLAAVIIVRDHL